MKKQPIIENIRFQILECIIAFCNVDATQYFNFIFNLILTSADL